MIIKLDEFTKAIAKVQSMASGEKTVPGIMLDISDEGVKVCYSDTRKALIQSVNATVEDTDIRGKIVLDYGRVVSAVTICQPSGRLRIEELHFNFKSDGKVTLFADKMLLIKDESGEDTLKKVSTFEQLLMWTEAGSSMKTSMLSRENYDGIFQPVDGVDEWDAEELKNLLNKTSGEKGKQIYISPKQGEAFVCNMAYVTTIPVGNDYTYPIVIATATGKCIADIINRLGVEKVYLHVVEGKYCKLYTEDKEFGMSFEIVPGNRTHMNVVSKYKGKSYTNVQLTFFKEVLQNVVKSAMAVSASEKVSLKLGKSEEEDQVELLVVGSNTNASIDNNYKVVTNGFNFATANGVTAESIIKDFDIPISLKVLYDIISKCESDYIGFDVCYEEGANAIGIRIADVDVEKVIAESKAILGGGHITVVEQIEEKDEHNTLNTSIGEFKEAQTVVTVENIGGSGSGEFTIEGVSNKAVKTSSIKSNEITMEDKINFREKTLNSVHYTLAAK